MLFTGCGTFSATSRTSAPRKQHPSRASLSGWQVGASVPLNRGSPTTSTRRFFSRCLLCAAGVVSSCRPCSWVSTVVKASCLFLVVVLEGGGWSGVLLLRVTRVQGASYLTGGLHRSVVLQPCVYLRPSSSDTAWPVNCFLQLGHLTWVAELC